jgi:hypothetical protein
MSKKICNILLLLLIFSLLFCSSMVSAGDSPGTSDWEFNLAPFYLWGINIDGDLTAGPVGAQVEVPFEDVFDSIEAAFIVHFETVYKAQWGFLVDVNYLDLENKVNLPMGISPNVDLNMTVAEFSGFYRLQRDAHAFDFIAGLRYIEVENTVSIVGGLTVLDGSKDWLDPLVGARWIWGFADGWSLIARGDIGGFGIGSEFSWQALGLVEWQPWKYASFIAGYRALGEDYEDGSGQDYFNFDATIHGPVLGLKFKW